MQRLLKKPLPQELPTWRALKRIPWLSIPVWLRNIAAGISNQGAAHTAGIKEKVCGRKLGLISSQIMQDERKFGFENIKLNGKFHGWVTTSMPMR
jgi:hypothetical protein